MDISKLGKDLGNTTSFRLKRRMASLMAKNPSYRHLDRSNQAAILKILEDFKAKKRRGLKITDSMIRRDIRSLAKQRSQLGLSRADFSKLKKLLNSLVD